MDILKKLEKGEKSYLLSVYFDDELTADKLKENLLNLKNNFGVSRDFLLLLMKRLKANGIGDNKTTEAINYIVDNFKFPPKISDIVNYEENKIRVYLPEHLNKVNIDIKMLCKLNTNTSRQYYVSKESAKRYSLPVKKYSKDEIIYQVKYTGYNFYFNHSDKEIKEFRKNENVDILDIVKVK